MNNNQNNKGSMIILTVIGIATILIAVIGATFAYFTVTVKNINSEPKTVLTQSGKMVIEYNSKNSINYTNALPGRPDLNDNNESVAGNSLQFTVSSDSEMSSSTTYDVYLKIEKNEFGINSDGTQITGAEENLVYYIQEYNTKKGSDSINGNKTFTDNTIGTVSTGTENYDIKKTILYGTDNKKYDSNNQVTSEILGKFKKTKVTSMEDNITPYYLGELISSPTSDKYKDTNNVLSEGSVTIGVIPSQTDPTLNGTTCTHINDDEDNCYIRIAKNAVLGNYGALNEWYFEIWLYENGKEQNYDQLKNFKASIEIVVTNSGILSNEIN